MTRIAFEDGESDGVKLGISDYQGGDITGQAFFSGKSLLGMGLPTTFTEYVYELSNNGGDTVKIQFGTQGGGGGGGQVPEPSTMAIFGLGALGMAYRARRKAKA